MLTYVYQNIIRALIFICPQAIIHFQFTFNFIFVFQNSIFKINTITHFTLQGFLYAQWYIIGGLDLFDTNKGWLQNTETTAIQWLLLILKDWGIVVKFKCFHTSSISYWNLKNFRRICILCIIMALKIFPYKSGSRVLKFTSI